MDSKNNTLLELMESHKLSSLLAKSFDSSASFDLSCESFFDAFDILDTICSDLDLDWRVDFASFEEGFRDDMRSRGERPAEINMVSEFDSLTEGEDWIKFHGIFIAKYSRLKEAARKEGYIK